MGVTVTDKSLLKSNEKVSDKLPNACLALDTKEAARQYHRLRNALPKVELFYAVKSFSHPSLLEQLYLEGCCFDIASTGEMKQLSKIGIDGRICINTHPIKTDQDIVDTFDFRCDTFVVDNVYELRKFVRYKDRAKILVRLGFQNKDVVVDLSKKFGCSYEDAREIIIEAKTLGINVIGLSFHVGSQCINSSQHVNAIHVCSSIIKEFSLKVLDIGGGFPVNYENKLTDFDIDTFCAPIREELSTIPDDVKIIAEPGRFISAPSMTSYCTVVGKAKRGDSFWYYLNDGVYGSYSGIIYDHMTYPLEVFTKNYAGDKFVSVFTGPTCDSIDVVAEGIMLPELDIGDVLVGYNMGAYTSASATDFNSIKKAEIIVV